MSLHVGCIVQDDHRRGGDCDIKDEVDDTALSGIDVGRQ